MLDKSTELVDSVWAGVPDFKEGYELPDGMFRTKVPAFEEVVVRELLVNALMHWPYTQRGDIYLNLHPEYLEVVNPGHPPLGVTPRSLLRSSRRWNDGLARVFHDIGLMEKEGSGFDLVFERLLASGRTAPEAKEGADSVHVTVPRRVIQPGVITLLAQADAKYQLAQRERIVLGLLTQTEGMASGDLASQLELDGPDALRCWTGRLVDRGLVSATGRTKARRHIHRRIGAEIDEKTVARAREALVKEGEVEPQGERRCGATAWRSVIDKRRDAQPSWAPMRSASDGFFRASLSGKCARVL